jgi:transposase
MAFGDVISANRRPGGELSTDQRAAILARHESGQSTSKLARDFHCARRTVTNTITRWIEHQTTKTLPRKGAPRVTDNRDRRAIKRYAKTNPKHTYAEIERDL